ncbi:MAG: hypothetical protein VX764_09690 [Planctomycetota bacterium]|nr:hypothetical protein [Planctomycetota bacterium]
MVIRLSRLPSPNLAFNLVLLTCLIHPIFSLAQFTPTLSTSLDNLEAGQASGFTQQGMFFQGQEGPASMLIEFDRGSFDFSGSVVGQSAGTLVVDVDVTVIVVTISGQIIADVQITSVGPDTMQAIAVITDITGNVAAGLSLLGIPLSIGDIAFNVLYNDFPDDTGASMNVTDAGTLPLSGSLDFDVPLTWTTTSILTHSPAGGDLSVNSVLTSTSGFVANINEVFPLTGGIDPPTGFNRGDANQDGGFDISDPVTMLSFLFNNGTVLCLGACDANDDNSVDIADAVYCLSSLFGGGALPAAPHGICGDDPTPGPLSCDQTNNCP